ncbi:MAG: hypothetical protein IJA78_06380 [Clostridia bacterium]|nr:hypothetical protein [Clostridia bacterium]
MMKRVIALVLCFASVLLCFTACAKNEEDKGAYIRMYLTEPIYDVDPLNAFDNEATLQIVSLLFAGLFEADEDGDPKKALVDDYEYVEDEDEGKYYLTLTLKETCWSDGVKITANDAQFAFRRLFDSATSHPATALLYDIKNARRIVAAEVGMTIDDLGVVVVDSSTLEIQFEGPIDLDTFLLALCSPALYPLRDDIVEVNPDWGKKSSTVICSGPFMLRSMDYEEKDGFILERNGYYFRDRDKDDVDKSVKPYRIVVDYKTPIADQLGLFNSEEQGALYYFGRIPMELREDPAFAEILKKLKITDAPSTHVYYLNQNAFVQKAGSDSGVRLFANTNVRQALSLAINREDIAKALVYATAADGIVPLTVLNRADRNATFRKKAESYITATANMEQAQKLLSEAGIKASSYSFSITVDANDEEHLAMAELIAAAWGSEGLGFKVKVNKLSPYPVMNQVEDPQMPGEFYTEPAGYSRSAYREALQSGSFEVIALDLVATSPDAFGYLAPFATAFSGNATDLTREDGALTPHITGYQNGEYEAKIEQAFAAEKNKERAKLLHEAEEILMRDMPAIPIVYNQNVSLRSSKISKPDSSFFCNADFTETKQKGYWKIALRDEFVILEEGDEGDGNEAGDGNE